jgi:predicted RNase H-like nuclease (RuvC/YqgF family)
LLFASEISRFVCSISCFNCSISDPSETETPRRVLGRKSYEKANLRQILYESEKVTDIDVTDLKAATDRIRTEESYITEIEQLKQEIEQTNLEISEANSKILELEKTSTFGIH